MENKQERLCQNTDGPAQMSLTAVISLKYLSVELKGVPLF